MMDFDIATEDQYHQTIADSLGVDYVRLDDYMEVPLETQRLIPGGTARLHGALPIGQSGNTIVTALLDPLDSQVAEDLRFALGRDVQVVVSPAYQMEERLNAYYGADMANMDEVLKELSSVTSNFGDSGMNQGDMANEANAAPIIRFVDLILYQAIQDRASDIHFEPFEYEFKIRYRVDGALYEMAPPPRHLALPVISRVKVMANLNIAERRLPQDGRIQRNIADRAVDLRVSTLPTQYGESVVLRVLDRSSVNLDLEALGHARLHLRLPDPHHRKAQRHFHRHRSDWLGQDDDPLRLPAQDQHRRQQIAHRRGPGGIRHRRVDPGAHQRRASG